jgi:hypothetical protein
MFVTPSFSLPGSSATSSRAFGHLDPCYDWNRIATSARLVAVALE